MLATTYISDFYKTEESESLVACREYNRRERIESEQRANRIEQKANRMEEANRVEIIKRKTEVRNYLLTDD